MERTTKSIFYRKYASKQCRSNVTAALAFAYSCAAVSLCAGAVARDYAAVAGAVPAFVLASVILATKSRLCAVALLLCACADAAMALVGGGGRISGWLLAAGGVFAVRGTFRLHSEYRAFIESNSLSGSFGGVGPGFGAFVPYKAPEKAAAGEAARRRRDAEAAAEAKKFAGRTFVSLLPFAGMFFGICLIWLSISPVFIRLLVCGAQSPEALIRAYRLWYITIVSAVAAAVLLSAACVVFSACRGMITVKTIQIMALSIAFPIFLGGYMVASEHIPSLIVRAGEDIAQIQSGRLKEVTVWLSPKSRPARLPGPYGKGQPEPVTRYGGISRETGGRWVHFYVPECLGFSLDENALYNEDRSIEWNMKNARRYLISCTGNFSLVVNVKPVDL